MMTIKQLRKYLAQGPQLIEWIPSGIVESATLLPNGAVRIENAITRKQYILPRRYGNDIHLKPFTTELVPLGRLLPKNKRVSHVSVPVL